MYTNLLFYERRYKENRLSKSSTRLVNIVSKLTGGDGGWELYLGEETYIGN